MLWVARSRMAWRRICYFRSFPRRGIIIAAGFLVLLIIVIGISRVYLGAHFPSDVLAGWFLGGLGLLVIILVIQPRIAP